MPILDNSKTAFNVISVYSQKDAIEDGLMVDVSETAREAGFKWPVAVTQALLAEIKPTPAERDLGQCLKGRMWDLVWMGSRAIAGKGAISNSGRIGAEMIVQRATKGGKPRNELVRYDVCLTFTSGGAPAISLTLPGED